MWRTLTWGLSTIVVSLKSYKNVYDEYEKQKNQAQSQEEIDSLSEGFNYYYFPFLDFIQNYMFRALTVVENEMSQNSNAQML